MTDRMQTGAAFWATVVVVAVLVGYPLSYGPVQSLMLNHYLPERLIGPVITFYTPLIISIINAPESMKPAINWYFSLWK